MSNIVIIGGSDAGISAALRIRELNPEIIPTMIVADSFPNFSICGLPYYISKEVTCWENLAHRTRQDIENAGINLLLEHTAQSIHPERKQVNVVDKSGAIKAVDYDKLIVGTGAISLKPKIIGIDFPGVFFLRWMPDCFKVDEFLNKQSPKTAVIIGAGYIGMEMAESLTKRGLKVNVVESADSVMPSVDVDFGIKIREMLTQNGITVNNNIAIESIDKIGDQLIVKGTNNYEMATDMVLVAVGSVPNTTLGQSIGIDTGIKGAFKVNIKMETNIPDVYAAGDCVETWHRILKSYTYLPLGTIAHKQGRVAGENAIGGNKEFAGTLGTQSVKIFDKVVARTGLNENEANKAGFQPVSVDFETWDHKVYFPPAEKIYIRVTADQKSKKILGAQILGTYKTEVSKRIDIFAAAIFHELTVKEFSDYDLSYTPPLSSPWDPVQMAVQSLERKL
ncbi:MAG TPA: CoA-disulfide reductase [Firmicutes bacterium]|jgi:NADPH-dependent 2,4-dienoyl-CoA reductase/sulfur reductase-like enzyme|nr:CoA-disulfide reductase [Bacillota bacterium]